MSAFQRTEFSWHSFPAVAAGSVVARLRAVLRGLRVRHDARTAVPALESLSEWQLKDLGITRSEIWYLAYGISASSTRSGHAGD